MAFFEELNNAMMEIQTTMMDVLPLVPHRLVMSVAYVMAGPCLGSTDHAQELAAMVFSVGLKPVTTETLTTTTAARQLVQFKLVLKTVHATGGNYPG